MTTAERIKGFLNVSPFSKALSAHLANVLDSMDFFNAPASANHHGAREGGLFSHSLNVYDILMKLTRDNDLEWSRPESPFVIAFLHDLCKTDQYRKIESGYEYRKDCLFTGHGEKSIMLINALSINVTEEELACIRYHMGAFAGEKEWSYYTGAIHRYPNVLWVHTADMLATHVVEYNREKVENK